MIRAVLPAGAVIAAPHFRRADRSGRSHSSFVEPTVHYSLNNGRVKGVSEPTSRAAKRAATAQRILDAARAEFGERGLEGATIRRIAQRAKVDPSLVMQHYGSKAALFAIAIQLDDAGPGDIESHLHDVLDVRLGALPPVTRALVRCMLTAPEAAAPMSAFLNE